jgi:beta-galactosidase
MSSSAAAAAAAARPRLEIDGDHFTRDGEPHRIVSGVVHYFRVLPQLWEDRLRRLAAMGCTTVETYVAWNVHQPRDPALAPASFDGGADLPAFCRLAGELGLDVIVRPGPYICAEWEFGGLPAWLLADPGMQLRCAYPGFLAAVDRWWDDLLPRLVPLLASNGGPIVAMQIENEYGSYGNDKTYLAHLRAGYERHGIDVLLFTADGPTDLMLAGGTLPDVLATVNFGSEPDAAFDLLRRHRPGTPLFCVEFWNGWFDHWGEPHHVRAADDAAATLRRMLDAGASVNFYVGHGGTNFGFYAGANHTPGPSGYQPTITSYDYDAPIGEAGELTPKFHAFREILRSVSATPLPEPPPDPARQVPQSLDLAATRAVTFRGLLDTLSLPVRSATPVSMEQLGQAYGYTHYQSVVPGNGVDGSSNGTLRLVGLADRAHVFVDGTLAGTVAREDENPVLELRIPSGGAELEILVENTGRVNYGPYLHDRKGLGQVWFDYQQLFDWRARPLPLDDIALVERAVEDSVDTIGAGVLAEPAFIGFDVLVAAVPGTSSAGDAFIALPGWTRGRVWLNGFNLGAYRAEGPQVTLYAPAPLWSVGRNRLLVLELDAVGQPIEIRDLPDLGRVRPDHEN